jgi:hypothetical protein
MLPGRPVPEQEDWMTFRFRIEGLDRRAVRPDPPTYATSVHSSHAGDRIPIRPDRTLQVVRVRDDDGDQAPVLVVMHAS